MKTYLIFLILVLVIYGCKKEDFSIGSEASVESLSLYWDHEVFGEGGRKLRFEFHESKEFENNFELVFDYKIEGTKIIVSLVDKIDRGKCPKFPTPNGIDSLCSPKGNFFIPDNQLNKNFYSLVVKTYDFEINSSLTADDEKFVLEIPNQKKISSSITTVYPIPENLLFGDVVFSGVENTQHANDFFNKLEMAGLVKTSVPNYPYRHLSVGDNGRPVDKHWEPDNHNLRFLYKMEDSFETVFELAKEHFNNSNVNIYLYSSNGDQAILSKSDGIVVEYAEK
jgi:hypothetical protein